MVAIARATAIAALLGIGASALGQAARIVLNNDPWLRIDNAAWVVVENPANTGIQTLGTGGNIRSEGEFNRIRWQIRNTTGSYVVPFTTGNGVKMPFTYEAIGGASNEAQASICFSTYNYGAIAGNNWDNNLYRPSDVTHMHNFWTGAPVNNSDNVVDRFWIIDPGVPGFAYAALPGIQLGFTYDPGAGTGDVRAGNAITGVSTVGAQRFNSPLGQWGDYWPSGVFAAGAVNSVTNVNVPSADFFRSWTLSNILEPLPVEFLGFDARCLEGRVLVRWTTGSERGISHFIIERSHDASSFEEIGLLEAVGNASAMTEYVFIDERPPSLGYYRIRAVEEDGARSVGPVRAAGCTNGSFSIVNAWDAGDVLNVVVSSPRDQTASLRLFDSAGKLVTGRHSIALVEGISTVELDQRGMAMGVYMLSIVAPDGSLTRRVPVY